MGSQMPTTEIDVSNTTVATITRLLSSLAEMPSTPPEVAQEATAAARTVESRIPFPRGRGNESHHGRRQRSHIPGTVPLERQVVISVAGLLDVFAGMPSTPPAVREEVWTTAEELWRLVGVPR